MLSVLGFVVLELAHVVSVPGSVVLVLGFMIPMLVFMVSALGSGGSAAKLRSPSTLKLKSIFREVLGFDVLNVFPRSPTN